MSWLLIIPLMIVCLFLNIRVYLAMFIGIIAYFLFFSSVQSARVYSWLTVISRNCCSRAMMS